MSSQDGMYRLAALVKEASWSLAFQGVKFLLVLDFQQDPELSLQYSQMFRGSNMKFAFVARRNS